MTDTSSEVLEAMIASRKQQIASCERMLELLQPEWDKFEARSGHDTYVARDYANHTSALRTHRKELEAILTLQSELAAARELLAALKDQSHADV